MYVAETFKHYHIQSTKQKFYTLLQGGRKVLSQKSSHIAYNTNLINRKQADWQYSRKKEMSPCVSFTLFLKTVQVIVNLSKPKAQISPEEKQVQD